MDLESSDAWAFISIKHCQKTWQESHNLQLKFRVNWQLKYSHELTVWVSLHKRVWGGGGGWVFGVWVNLIFWLKFSKKKVLPQNTFFGLWHVFSKFCLRRWIFGQKSGFFFVLWESSGNQLVRLKEKRSTIFRSFFENPPTPPPPPPLEKILDPPLNISFRHCTAAEISCGKKIYCKKFAGLKFSWSRKAATIFLNCTNFFSINYLIAKSGTEYFGLQGRNNAFWTSCDVVFFVATVSVYPFWIALVAT